MSSAASVMIQIFPPCLVVYAPMIRAPVLSASRVELHILGAEITPVAGLVSADALEQLRPQSRRFHERPERCQP